MKKIILAIAFLFTAIQMSAQSFAINTDGSTANASALLDVKSTSKGILVPRMSKLQKNAISSPAAGLLIFQNAPDSVGFHYYDGTKWLWLPASNSLDTIAWKTAGNTGTNISNHFFGTLDNVPLSFRQNNKWLGRIDATGRNVFLGAGAGQLITNVGNVAIGDSALASGTLLFGNVAIGNKALKTNNNFSAASVAIGSEALMNATNVYNTAVGYQSSMKITSGQNNTAIGANTLKAMTTEYGSVAIGASALERDVHTAPYSPNTAVGTAALYSNDMGYNNTAVGYRSQINATSGNSNVTLGTSSGQNITTQNNNTAIGYTALNAGANNAAFGFLALTANTGNNNTAVGYNSSFANTTGQKNIAVGAESLFFNTTGNNNVAIGDKGTLPGYKKE